MDNYTKMCKELKELQEGWEPKVGDRVWRKYTIFGEEIDKTIWKDDNQRMEIIILTFKSSAEGYFHATNKDGDERIFKTPEDLYKSTCIYLPSLEQLIGMLEGVEIAGDCWDLSKTLDLYRIATCDDVKFYAPTPQEALLKLVAWEKWGKTWDEDKEVWEEG